MGVLKSYIFIVFLSATVNAKNYNTIFKKTKSVTKNETYITCELKNVKYDGRDIFHLIANKTELEVVAGLTPDDDYIDEDEIFGYVTLFKFTSSKLSSIPMLIFRNFSQLQIFDASETELKSLNTLTFNDATSLQEIFLQNNRLTTIDNYVFVHTKDLKVLDLSNNNIQKVQTHAFNSLHKLQKLSLGNNRIEDLEDTTFEPLSSLEYIWLDRNRMTMISSELFSKKNPNLKGIFFDSNQVNLISPYAFDNLHKLHFLTLKNNKCIDLDFINHVISDNSGIKLELRECHKNYRNIVKDVDEKFNITQKASRTLNDFTTCLQETQIIEESLLTIQEKNAKLQKPSGN